MTRRHPARTALFALIAIIVLWYYGGSKSQSQRDVIPFEYMEPNIPKDKIFIIGKLLKEDTSWTRELPGWSNKIYIVESETTQQHTAASTGKEAVAFLTYIIDHYYSLPATIAFVHGGRDGYPEVPHTDGLNHSNVYLLSRLNIAFVQRNGFANLRCNQKPGCPADVHPFNKGHDAEHAHQSAIPEVWKEFFGNDDVPEALAAPCCSQFAVSRERVMSRPRVQYLNMRRWLMAAKVDDHTTGQIMEYLWHVIFGMESVYCPDMVTCRCDLYGECTRELRRQRASTGPTKPHVLEP